MINKINPIADTKMDSIEDELFHALNVDGEDVNNNDDDFYDDDEDIVFDNNIPNFVDNMNGENETVPDEISDYITSLESQTKRLERELEECDELLSFNPHETKFTLDNAVVATSELEELKEAAAEAGMTVEEFREKLLRDIDEDEFDEEKVDGEYNEISTLQKELEEARLEIKKMNDDIDDEVTAFLDDRAKKMQGLPLAITEGENGEVIENGENEKEDPEIELRPVDLELSSVTHVSNKGEDRVVVIATEFPNFREFIKDQLKKTDSKAEERRKQLRMMFEAQHQKEEERMLKEEEYKRSFRHQQEKEAEMLMTKKMEEEKRIEDEIKNQDLIMEEEYQSYQTNIEQLNAALEEEKQKFEMNQELMKKDKNDRMNKAATDIQRVYKGYRTRVLMQAAIQELQEMKELRKKEKEQLRVMEIQYEMDFKAEQEKKKKEESEQKEAEERKREEESKQHQELERMKKEEAERIDEETRREEARRMEEKNKEEERKRKEEEDEAKKETEKRKREEEQRKKEEEKKRKEEEKKRKDEEKKRKEEEKRQKQEEKKRKIDEEKKRKEEEKRLKEEQRNEEKRIRHEQEKKNEEEKRLLKEEGNKVKENEELTLIKSHEKTEGDTEESSYIQNQTLHDSVNEARNSSLTTISVKTKPNETLPEKPRDNDDDCKEQQSLSETPSISPKPLGTLSPHPPAGSPTLHDSKTTPRHRSISNKPQIIEVGTELTNLPLTDQYLLTTQENVEVPKGPSPVEKLRWNWMKSCTPWSKVSNEPWKLNQSSATKLTKRPYSGKKKYPPIPETVVLSAAHANSLREVSCMETKDLPGYSLSTLSQCWNIRYLTITQSGLVSLDGLASCKHLLYINATENVIEYVDLKDVGCLQYLNLSANKLGSIHGLQGCINLRWLNLSRNDIRKVSDLNCLRRLHTLNLAHNQITSCEGLDEAVTLQDVDISNNFLQSVTGINRLCLLTRINLASNNLLQPPVLKNAVLLQWLQIQENSIQSLETFSQYWLPLLHFVDASNNRLEDTAGLDKLVCLSTLDVSHNQIPDVESLNECLQSCQGLQSLSVAGNPLVDIQEAEYRDSIANTASQLQFLDGEVLSVKEKNPVANNDSLRTYHQQIGVHKQMREDLDAATVDSKLKSEALCSLVFHYCDASFKMAVEHRSIHEYGNILSSMSSPANSGPLSALDESDSGDHLLLELPKSRMAVKPLTGGGDLNTSNSQRGIDSQRGINGTGDQENNSKAKFDSVLVSNGENVSMNGDKTWGSQGQNSDRRGGRNGASHSKDGKVISTSQQSAFFNLNKSAVTSHLNCKGKSASVNNGNEDDDVNNGALDDDSDDDLVDVTKDDSTVFIQERNKPNLAASSAISQQLSGMNSMSYMSEKDKFLMALGGGNASQRHSGTKDDFESIGQGKKFVDDSGGKSAKSSSITSWDEKENLHHSSTYNSKNLFVAALSEGEAKGTSSGVKANVVGAYLGQDGLDNDGIKEFDLDQIMDETFDFDNPDFDFDKYLDMGEIDEFLEKGWRPEESPQIPSSNYPVLGKINHHHPPQQKQRNGAYHSNMTNSNNIGSTPFGHPTPPPPPTNPHQAWKDNHHGLPQQQHQRDPFSPGPINGIPPLPNPSPSPSSVASAAETLGGGSVKSKKRDDLCEEWGFKDGRTAELMMARARKMKYNSEKKKRLSKLNPQQRYQLFQKLEESGKIQHVRPPPAKILPRKEYFQAREEEAQRQDFERRQEEKSRVNRTFEWLHTQVGDHQISSSRINPAPAPVYHNQEMTSGYHNNNSMQHDHRQISPSSDHNVASRMAEDHGQFTGRRYSVGDTSSVKSPMLPPIAISSAPSHRKKEKMSFRTEPVELSGGWGGGKKRCGKS